MSDLNKCNQSHWRLGTFVSNVSNVSDVSNGTLVTDTADKSSRYVRLERKTLPDPCSEEWFRKGSPLQVSR